MRFNQQEKYEIIQLVEDSDLGVNRTLQELGISKGRIITGMVRTLSRSWI